MDLDALSGSKDPFAALDEEDADKAAAAEEQDARAKAEIVHIRVQQRNGRKCITTVQGLNRDLDLKRILKVIKKQHCCNGTVVDADAEGKNMGEVLQLQGDQRANIHKFLVDNELHPADKIKIHGHG